MSMDLNLDAERSFSIIKRGTLNTKLFNDVIAHFGSQSKLALVFGVHRSCITQWIKANHLPAERALQIEELSNGKFIAIELLGMCYERADL
jgi:hypothetical protein